MLRVTDDAGGDAKVLAVPFDKLTSQYADIKSPHNLPQLAVAPIVHVFQHYRDLEPGKWVTIEGWAGADDAWQEIMSGVANHRKAANKPMF